MKITCYYSEDGPDMGYIYLMPNARDVDEYPNEIMEHIDPDNMIIPYGEEPDAGKLLNAMEMAAETFRKDYDTRFDTEYGNDLDEEGYIKGIELFLPKNRFIELINSSAFRVIRTLWQDKPYHVVTFEQEANVFHPDNMIYKLTEQDDVWMIVQLVEPEILGFRYPDPSQRKLIVQFKALVSAREDLYPVDYLLSPRFILVKDLGLPR